ncbi:MAG: hypothetical protein MHPSP_002401, partial [Paramarteilia canceri]
MKSRIVQALTEYTDSITLAIGDGANDVSMLQSAPVSIGIRGREGMAAANSADISVGKFYDMKNVIFVHGAWNYSRLSKMTVFMLYKNIIMVVNMVCFILYSQMNPIKPFNEWSLSLNNVLFTSFPVIPLALLSKNLSYRLRMKFPVLYKSSNCNNGLTRYQLFCWFLLSCYHGIIPFMIIYYSYPDL